MQIRDCRATVTRVKAPRSPSTSRRRRLESSRQRFLASGGRGFAVSRGSSLLRACSQHDRPWRRCMDPATSVAHDALNVPAARLAPSRARRPMLGPVPDVRFAPVVPRGAPERQRDGVRFRENRHRDDESVPCRRGRQCRRFAPRARASRGPFCVGRRGRHTSPRTRRHLPHRGHSGSSGARPDARGRAQGCTCVHSLSRSARRGAGRAAIAKRRA